MKNTNIHDFQFLNDGRWVRFFIFVRGRKILNSLIFRSQKVDPFENLDQSLSNVQIVD